MDFGRQRGFLLDGEDSPEKVGSRKESYFLEFMYVDVARGVLLECYYYYYYYYYYFYYYYYYYYYHDIRSDTGILHYIKLRV